MASVTSLMNSTSSTSSLYGNRNVISGLASGMDTEAMIENSVAGYKTKISSLQQKMTQMQWKQDAYRSLITQMNNLLNKYTSYTSSTNLFSSSFFSKAINTVANGANAAKVSATGKSSSNVSIDAIKQLAEAASYTVGTNHLVDKGSDTSKIEWNKNVETSKVAGSITLEYGGGDKKSGSTIRLSFGEDEVFNSAQEMADAINAKLKEAKITTSSGSNSADNYLEASVDATGRVVINDKKNNNFRITGVSGEGMEKIFEETERGSLAVSKAPVKKADLVNSVGREEYLKDQTIYVNLDGKTKSIKLEDIFNSDTYKNATKGTEQEKSEAFATALNERLNSEFNGKVKVEANADGSLKFTGPENNGSTLTIKGGSDAVNNALGLGEGGYSTTLQTSWTLKKVLGDSAAGLFTEAAKNADGDYVDKDGKVVDSADKAAKVATIEINGTKLQFGEDDTIQTVMDKINGSDAGVELKYSSMTGNFAFTAKETGADSKIDIGGTLGTALFGKVDSSQIADDKAEVNPDIKGTYTKGKDAEFVATVNGERLELTRSSNTVDLDGLSVTLKGTFDEGSEKITFTTTSDSDKIVDTVKAFVEDYNKLVTELHNAYSTMPLQDSKGNDYLPLTEDEISKNSESYIKSYEEKAKTGLLFGDSDLSNLYTRLTQSVQGSGEIGVALRSIGLSVEYSSSNGLSTLNLDEEKLRSALDSDPDKVKNAFTASTSTGASSNGIMAGLKSTLEMYGKTSIGSPGILVKKAGTTLSSYSLSDNEIQDKIDSLQKQIEKWQDKMSDRIDFYTNQFTRLEMLINQMNSQSSALSGMMGG
nr:flagellar filament capping protein FliD [Acutalibacter muris]